MYRWHSECNPVDPRFEEDKKHANNTMRPLRKEDYRQSGMQSVAIREMAGSQREIAKQFGVCQQCVSAIKTHRTWAHL